MLKSSKKAVEHTYKCCKNSLSVLRKFNSFFEIEDQMDISFYKENNCVFFTISHEDIAMVDLDIWKDFFDNTNVSLIKVKNY